MTLKDQLIIPVYLNEKTVLDMLAIIEDGFSRSIFRFQSRHAFMASWRRKTLQSALNAYLTCSMNCSEYLIFSHPLSSQ